MSTIEALRLQLDNLQKEKQELEVANVQLKALYEEVLKHRSDNETNSTKSQQTIAALQEHIVKQCSILEV